MPGTEGVLLGEPTQGLLFSRSQRLQFSLIVQNERLLKLCVVKDEAIWQRGQKMNEELLKSTLQWGTVFQPHSSYEITDESFWNINHSDAPVSCSLCKDATFQTLRSDFSVKAGVVLLKWVLG